MAEKVYLIDDREIVIPEEIRRMTKEEKIKEIARLEAEALSEKNRLIQNNKSNNNGKCSNVDDVFGILSKYANSALIPFEEGAWEKVVAENYKKELIEQQLIEKIKF